MNIILKIGAVGLLIMLTAACSVTTREIKPDEKVIYDKGYHFSDKNDIVEAMVDSLLSKPPLF